MNNLIKALIITAVVSAPIVASTSGMQAQAAYRHRHHHVYHHRHIVRRHHR